MTVHKQEVQCQYLRTTWLFHAHVSLILPDLTRIRFFSEIEAAKFAETIRKRNLFARVSGPNNFYLKRAAELGNRTVIEVFRIAIPNDMLEIGEDVAGLIEKLAILSTTLFMRRDDLLRKLSIGSNTSPELNFVVSSQFNTVHSRSKRLTVDEGILIDKQFCNRFTKSGFVELFRYCQTQGDLNKRVHVSADWLLESRRETRLNASVVKTAIALETLLIFSESESLARSLSERSAFILSSSPELRLLISRIILRFYDVRSGIVHGSQKKAKKLTPALTECVDRLTLLILLMIASNSHLWLSVESLRLWCEAQRWGKPSTDIKSPYSQVYLRNALAMVVDEMQSS